MAGRFWLFLCLFPLTWLGGAHAARCQDEKSRYTRIPFNGDPTTLLRQRLLQAQRLDQLLRQYGNLNEKLKKYVDVASLPKLDEHGWDPEKLEKLKEAMKQMKLDGMVPPEIKRDAEQIKKQAEEYATSLHKKDEAPNKAASALPEPETAAGDGGEVRESMSRWALDMLEKANDTDVGTMLQQSPAWKNAIADLKDFIANPQTGKGKSWDLGLDKFSLPAGLEASLEKTWERIRAMELPTVPKIEVSAPKLGVSNALSKLPVPRRWPVGDNLWWLVVVACVALIAWQLWQRSATRRRAAAVRLLGPWPVPPERIASAADLIAAFEYLAALRLGAHVRTWNHRAVAEQLGREDDERRNAAAKLAALYEQARYSPAAATLSEETLATARHDLCFLAGVALP